MAAIVVVDIIILNQILFLSYKYCLNVAATIDRHTDAQRPTAIPIQSNHDYHASSDCLVCLFPLDDAGQDDILKAAQTGGVPLQSRSNSIHDNTVL